MATCHLPARRGRVRAHPVRIPDRRGDHIAARRMERLAAATLPRASAARAVAVRLDAVLVPRGQRAVARLGDGDRLRGAIVHDPAVDRDPEGEGRHPPLVGANPRVCRRSAHHPSRRRHADLRRAVRARQRGLYLDRGDRDPPHEHDRVARDADAYQMSIMTLCSAGLLTLGFRAPHWGDALMVALAGVGNGIAQYWWTRSLSLAPPSAVVPF